MGEFFLTVSAMFMIFSIWMFLEHQELKKNGPKPRCDNKNESFLAKALKKFTI